MTDDTPKKTDWTIGFLGKLCLIGWTCVVLYETFDFFKPVRQIFFLFGFWACAIALLNAMGLFFIRRHGIFLVFAFVAGLPMLHFGLVARNIAAQKLAAPAEVKQETEPVEVNDSKSVEANATKEPGETSLSR